MATPWLTVIVPTYNGQAWLPLALESICGEADARLEVLAVDDGSTDGTLDILRSYRGRLALSINARSHSGNWTASVNHALAVARGAYASVLPQDDLWLPGRLRAMRGLAERFPGASLVISAAIYIDAAGNRVGRWHCPLPPQRELAQDVIRDRLIVQNFIALPAAFFSRAAALEAGGLDEDLWYTADWDLWLKLARAGSVVYEPAPLAAFRLHRQSQTMKRALQCGELRRQLETVYERHAPDRMASRRCARIARTAAFSIEMNLALARRAAGGRASLASLAGRLLRLGPLGWIEYLRYSRIRERAFGRWRAGLQENRL